MRKSARTRIDSTSYVTRFSFLPRHFRARSGIFFGPGARDLFLEIARAPAREYAPIRGPDKKVLTRVFFAYRPFRFNCISRRRRSLDKIYDAGAFFVYLPEN